MRSHIHKIFLAVASALLVSACATLSIDLPAITDAPAQQKVVGRVIWHDLLTNDIDASQAFYGELFGWDFEEVPLSLGLGRSSKYLLIRNQGRLIGGMVDTSRLSDEANNSQWISVMSVNDVDAAVKAVAAAGGQIKTPPTGLNQRGTIAIVADSSGAVFAMLETRYGDPEDLAARPGDFFWDEVWTDDIGKATDFYTALAPFESVSRNTGEARYEALAISDEPMFGLLQDPIPELEPTWVPYIKVVDMSVLERVAAAGGVVALPAENRPLGGEVALILGPSGAGVALQTWSEEN
jgi:predicted enzyme related to lactoylglutathione lyase